MKYLSVSLIIILLFSCFSISSAEDRKEITFRGIPWGTSIAEIEKMSTWNYVYSYEDEMPFESDFLIQSTWRSFSGTEFNAGYEGTAFFFDKDIKVGGYEVSDITFFCMYGVDDGALNKDKAASELYAAEYHFDLLDYQAAYTDLKGKLTDLYGIGTSESLSEESWFYTTEGMIDYTNSGEYTIWDGLNNTHVLIFATWIEDEDSLADKVDEFTRDMVKFLYITYYKGDVDQALTTISNLERQIERQQESQNSGGYDGL